MSQDVAHTWEYRVLSVPSDALERTLNDLGADHWELVTLVANRRVLAGDTTCSCVLKRPRRIAGASIPWAA